MSDLNSFFSLLKGTKDEIDSMGSLKKRKNPILAAIIGFMFGPFGVGLYLESWSDFFTCLIVLILLMFTVALAPIGWLFAGAYGYYRVNESNKSGVY